MGCGGWHGIFWRVPLLKLCDESVCIQRPTLNHVNLEGMLSEGASLLKSCVGSGYCIQR